MSIPPRRARRRWRDYRTSSGRSPVKDFIMGLPLDDRAAVAAAMKDVRIHGNLVAHHLRGDIYEVKARANRRQFRILYATEGNSEQILLALHAIVKKTRTVPGRDITLAERRLRDWRSRSHP
jgi:phage-related protein